jgi:hypothetical protein
MAEIVPLQQTVFEQGPQATFVPPAQQAQVYQEGQVVFGQPIYTVDPGIAWEALGAEAAKTASTLFENTLNYLIESKGNAVKELKDKYESELNTFYNEQSTALYSKDPAKRITPQQSIDNVNAKIIELRDKFLSESGTALETNEYFADEFDIKKYGMAYQRLALTARNSLRDFDTRSSRLLYDTQRVVNGLEKEKSEFGSWKNSDIGKRPDKLEPLALTGNAPLPTKDGYPIIGFQETEDGTPTVPYTAMINGVETPVVQKDENNNWVLIPEALEALPEKQLELAFRIDQEAYGDSSAVLSAGGQPTTFFEGALKQAAKNPQLNAGLTAYTAIALAQLPDHTATQTISGLSGLEEDDRLMLSMLRQHFINGGRKDSMPSITGLNRDVLRTNATAIQKLRLSPTIAGVATRPTEVAKYKELTTTLTEIAQQYELPVEDNALSLTKGPYDLTDTDGLTASALLQDNPVLVYALARVSTMMDSNPSLYANDPELKEETMKRIFKEVITTEGYFVTQNPNTGSPLIVYSRGLGHVNKARQLIKEDPMMLKDLPELQEAAKEDPNIVDGVIANSYLYETQWATNRNAADEKQIAFDTARRINPQVDLEVFEAIYDAAVTVSQDPKTKARVAARTQAPLTFGQILRMAVASSPAAMEQTGKVVIEGRENTVAEFKDRLAAAKQVWDDTDFNDGSDNAVLEFDTNPAMFSFMGAPTGGIPLKIRQLKGKSGKDYFPFIVGDSQRNFGAFSPKLDDNTPIMFIKAETDTQGMDQYRLNLSISKYLDAKRGKPAIRYVDYSTERPPNVGPLSAQDVINVTNERYLPLDFNPVGNADAPLTTFEAADNFRIINSQAIQEAVKADPSLKDVVPLLYEVARDKDGTVMYEENKTVFSRTNLRKLFDKAVKQGAKTNRDYVGYIFRAMRNYQQNDQQDAGRKVSLAEATNSPFTAFLGQEGKEKGVVLYEPSTVRFFDGVDAYVSTGYNLFAKGNQYYMFKPDELSIEQARSSGYKLIIDHANKDQQAPTDFTVLKTKKDRIEQAKSMLFSSRTSPLTEREKFRQQLFLQITQPREQVPAIMLQQ